MKETIFFNREQLKIIRKYGLLYEGFFRYGIIIAAFFLSLISSFAVFASGYFSSIPLFETAMFEKNTNSTEEYREKQETTRQIPSLQSKVLHGQINFQSGILASQDNLLMMSGLVLPRTVMISENDLKKFAQNQEQELFNDQYLQDFFIKVISNPIKQSKFIPKQNNFAQLTGTIHETFGLDCMKKKTKHSFVCKAYIRDFLEHFFLYEINKKNNNGENETVQEIGTEEIIHKGAIKELQELYPLLRKNKDSRISFCQGLLRYGQYGGQLDDQFSEIFRDCGGEQYRQYTLLKDFRTLTKSLEVGYVSPHMYVDKDLNQYKLFSLQQLLYKQLLTSTDVKPVMESYLGFLFDLLTKEAESNTEGIPSFAKTFTYRYNTHIMVPYLKDENSKMNKENRTNLMNRLLAIHYGDRAGNFIGLEKQAHYKGENEIPISQTPTEEKIDLEKLFKSSYMPAQFTLIGIEKGEEENIITVKGVDRKTELTIKATLKYENIQLSVIEIIVEKNEKLTEYLNALIANENYSLNKVLNLMNENKDIAEQTKALNMDLCSQIEEKFKKEVISCSEKEIKIKFMLPKKEDNKQESELIYTFIIENKTLKNVQISDKTLETKILREIDFSLIDRSNTFYMISSIVGYMPEDQNAGFGMKEHILVTDKFSKYLGIVPEKVTSEGGNVKVFFKVNDISFIGTYNLVTNELDPIALDFGTKRRPVIVQKLKLSLQENKKEELNSFMIDPLEYLRKINKALVKKYFPEKDK